jgi:pyruvate-ferredoxin/flavodoxin oxidoreductase
MVNAVFQEVQQPAPKNHFTVGITDDVTNTSLACDDSFVLEPDNVVRALFYGLGADGTVGANKNSIKIIGEETDNFAQGYFVYDSKKAGTMTVSHLRFGPEEIRSSYLIQAASFVACHQCQFLDKTDVLAKMVPGGTFLLNTVYPPAEVWDHLPRRMQETLIAKRLKFFVIDAYQVAKDVVVLATNR